MHNLIIMNPLEYRENVEILVINAAYHYQKACYISLNDPYHIVINMLQNANIKDKFIVIDASSGVKEELAIDKTTYVLPVESLFNVYIFLRELIQREGIKILLLDSLSALIIKHPKLPLKDMLTNLLLEVGRFRCDSSLFVFTEHSQHEIVKHLEPFIAKNIIL